MKQGEISEQELIAGQGHAPEELNSSLQLLQMQDEDPVSVLPKDHTVSPLDMETLQDPEAPQEFKNDIIQIQTKRSNMQWLMDNWALGEEDVQRADLMNDVFEGKRTLEGAKIQMTPNYKYQDLNYEGRWDPEALFAMTIRQGPMIKGMLGSGAIGAGFGATGALGVNVIPGLAFLPEDVFTIPSGVVLGAAFGAAAYGARQTQGSIGYELTQAGVSVEDAKLPSFVIGAVSGLVDAVQMGQLTHLGISAFQKALGKEETKGLLVKAVKNKLLQNGLGYAQEVATQEVEEVVQQMIETVGVELTKLQVLGEQWDPEKFRDTLVTSMVSAAVQSLGPSLILPGAFAGAGHVTGKVAEYGANSLFGLLNAKSAELVEDAGATPEAQEAAKVHNKAVQDNIKTLIRGDNPKGMSLVRKVLLDAMGGKEGASAAQATDPDGNVLYTAPANPLDDIMARGKATADLYQGLITTDQTYTDPDTGYVAPVYEDVDGNSWVVDPIKNAKMLVPEVDPGGDAGAQIAGAIKPAHSRTLEDETVDTGAFSEAEAAIEYNNEYIKRAKTNLEKAKSPKTKAKLAAEIKQMEDENELINNAKDSPSALHEVLGAEKLDRLRQKFLEKNKNKTMTEEQKAAVKTVQERVSQNTKEQKQKLKEIQKLETQFNKADKKGAANTAIANNLEKAYQELETLQIEQELLNEAQKSPQEAINTLEEGYINQKAAGLSVGQTWSMRAKSILREAATLKAGVKASRALTLKEVTDVQTRLKSLLNAVVLDPATRSNFLGDIIKLNTVEKFENNIEALVTKIEAFNEKTDLKFEKARVDKLLDRNQPVKSGKRPVGKMTAHAQVFVDAVKKFTKDAAGQQDASILLKKTFPAEEGSHESILDQLLDEDADPVLVNTIAAAQASLGYNGFNSKQTKSLADTLQGVVSEGRKTRAEILELRKATQEVINRQGEEALKTNSWSETAIEYPDNIKGNLRRLGAAIKAHLGSNQMFWDNLMEYITPNDPQNRLRERFSVEKATQNEKVNRDAVMKSFSDTVAAAVKKSGGDKNYLRTFFNVFGVTTHSIPLHYGEEVNGVFTKDHKKSTSAKYDKFQVLNMYLALKDRSTGNLLDLKENSGFTLRGEVPAGTSTEEVIESILSETDKAVAGALIEFFGNEGYYQRFNSFYSAREGINLPQIENYWAISRREYKKSAKEGAAVDGKPTMVPNSAKTRTGGKGSRIWGNPFTQAAQAIRGVEHYIAWKETSDAINGFFLSNVEAQKVLNGSYGEDVASLLETHAQIYTRGSVGKKFGDKAGSYFLKNLAGAKLMFGGVKQFALQLSTTTAYWGDMQDLGNIPKAWAHFAKNIRTEWPKIVNNPLIQARYKSLSTENEEFFQWVEAQRTLGGNVTWMDLAFLPMNFGDKAAVLIGGYPLYYETLQRTGSEEEAIAELARATESLQQSGDLTKKNLYQFQGKLLQSTFGVFLGPTNLRYQKVILDSRRYLYNREPLTTKKGREQFAWYAQQMLFNYAIPVIAQEAVQTAGSPLRLAVLGAGAIAGVAAFGDEDWEELEDLVFGFSTDMVSGIVAGGQQAEVFLEMAWGLVTDTKGENRKEKDYYLKKLMPAMVKEYGWDTYEGLAKISEIIAEHFFIPPEDLITEASLATPEEMDDTQKILRAIAQVGDTWSGKPLTKFVDGTYDALKSGSQGDITGAFMASPTIGGYSHTVVGKRQEARAADNDVAKEETIPSKPESFLEQVFHFILGKAAEDTSPDAEQEAQDGAYASYLRAETETMKNQLDEPQEETDDSQDEQTDVTIPTEEPPLQ